MSTVESRQGANPVAPPLPGTAIGGAVGIFRTDFTLWSADRAVSRRRNGLVDTRASYSLAPASVLEELGVPREETIRFVMADGSRRDLPIGWATIELQGRTRNAYFVFGPENAGVLLGAIALETFGLAADVTYQQLVPAQLTL